MAAADVIGAGTQIADQSADVLGRDEAGDSSATRMPIRLDADTNSLESWIGRTLEQTAIKDVVPGLMELLRHDEWQTRTAAVRALLKLAKQRKSLDIYTFDSRSN